MHLFHGNKPPKIHVIVIQFNLSVIIWFDKNFQFHKHLLEEYVFDEGERVYSYNIYTWDINSNDIILFLGLVSGCLDERSHTGCDVGNCGYVECCSVFYLSLTFSKPIIVCSSMLIWDIQVFLLFFILNIVIEFDSERITARIKIISLSSSRFAAKESINLN
jgi:hypothetical protein